MSRSIPLSERDPELFALINAACDGTLTDEQRQRLNERLMQDNRALQDYLVFLDLHASLRWKHRGGVAPSVSDASEEPLVVDSSILVEVIEQERAAAIRREAEQALQRQQAEEEEKRRRASWARLNGMKQKEEPQVHKRLVIPTPIFYGGVAAAITLMLMIGYAVFRPLPKVNDSPPPVANVPAERPVVATLVRTLDAVWAERHVKVHEGEQHEPAPLRGGAGLREGDSYTLTQGFAQLETDRGAIVVLEAPCEIELLGENRVKLSRGKLVGECSTLASKGFTVDTPNARIVDLGTEFGVQVSESGVTECHVIEGAVDVVPDSAPSNPHRLNGGKAARVDAQGRLTAGIVAQPARFIASIEEANWISDPTAFVEDRTGVVSVPAELFQPAVAGRQPSDWQIIGADGAIGKQAVRA
ncbi:MAG: FecR domain-containing protein, partial [Firmicutes bacterium]|nr:FecR domain-containing protein [Bacillota bacterium]